MKVKSLEDFFVQTLQYAFDAEKQQARGLSKLAKAVSTPQLREAFEQHQGETQEQIKRLEQVFEALEKKAHGTSNPVVHAFIEEVDNIIEKIEASPLRDAALCVSANQVEHYEIAVYGSLRRFAELMGNKQIVQLLEKTLEEEKQADAKITEVGEQYVNEQAAQGAEAGVTR